MDDAAPESRHAPDAMDGAQQRTRIRLAIDEASDEVGLESWYRSCAEPLVFMDASQFPSCCGAGCEPCSHTLIEVAVRARRILERER